MFIITIIYLAKGLLFAFNATATMLPIVLSVNPFISFFENNKFSKKDYSIMAKISLNRQFVVVKSEDIVWHTQGNFS